MACAAGPTLRDIEKRVLEHDWFSNGEREVSADDIRALVESGSYRASSGAPYGALHYRRSLDDGSCLHLVLDNDVGRLHHDAFDPHAGIYRLAMHLAHDARVEAITSVALAWSLVKLLERR